MAVIVTAISLKSGSVRQALSPRSRHPPCNRVRHSRSKNELGPVVHAVAASKLFSSSANVSSRWQRQSLPPAFHCELLILTSAASHSRWDKSNLEKRIDTFWG